MKKRFYLWRMQRLCGHAVALGVIAGGAIHSALWSQTSVPTQEAKQVMEETAVVVAPPFQIDVVRRIDYAVGEKAVAQSPHMPMVVNYAESASNRSLQKRVLDSRVLDSMESTEPWVLDGKGEMKLVNERWKDGSHSLRLRTKTTSPEEGPPKGQRLFGEASLTRRFEGEDWTRFNRISLWVYPDLPGWRVVTARIFMQNDGEIKLPGSFSMQSDGEIKLPGRFFMPVYHAVVMQNHTWNQVVWEIEALPRDRVVGVKFECRRQGNEPQASDMLSFDIDRLELQRVEPDKFEGWSIVPGAIAFSHTGYQIGSIKKAIASDLAAQEFDVFSQETGQRMLTKPLQKVVSQQGEFQVMDFSEIRQPGSYVLRAGGVLSRPFQIGDDVWRGTIWKAINFFYVERCGADIPGAHRICHGDCTVEHKGKRIVINGGWHDAGDLSQGLVNTSEAVYAMLALAEKLKARNGEDALYQRVVEEAKWGLDWVNKTSFGDGYRVIWSTMGLWTNGILGDYDNLSSTAQSSAFENFLAAATEAVAARVLRQSDPDLAAYNLQLARADFRFALQAPSAKWGKVVTASEGILAALDLFRVTGEQQYADTALQLSSVVINSQQRSFLPGLDRPLTGFFYTGPDKVALLHHIWHGNEQAPIAALAKLCETFPEHPDWIEWYSSVVLHSQFYQQAMSKVTDPFRMLPNSIHKADEYLRAPEADRENIRQQILNGSSAGDGYYIKTFPVQPRGAFRGNYGTLLSQAKSISIAAHLRRSVDLAQLAEEQLYWIVGRNPFAQSTMYGEGYDYPSLYSAMSGDIVGAVPGGMMTKANYDFPYWPTHNVVNFKEVWVHPVSRWLSLMADLAGPAIVEGQADSPVQFMPTGAKEIEILPDFSTGRFRAEIPEGQYVVRSGTERRSITVLPTGVYPLELRRDRALDIQLSGTTSDTGEVAVHLVAQGSGAHRFAIRSENVSFQKSTQEIDLSSEHSMDWVGRIISRDMPWVAVVVPDSDVLQRHEVVGWLGGSTASLPGPAAGSSTNAIK